MTEDEVVAMIGQDRLDRLLHEQWLSPAYRCEGYEDHPMYARQYVKMRYREELEMERHSPASVTKARTLAARKGKQRRASNEVQAAMARVESAFHRVTGEWA
jgi:hypothetical protein